MALSPTTRRYPRQTRASALALAVGALGLVLCASIAEARVLNVSAGGTCSDKKGTPFCTISAAAAKAVAGDTVVVTAASYAERVTLTRSGTAGAPIAFVGSGGPVVTGKVYGFDLSGVAWVQISGFTIASTTSHGIRLTLCSNVTLSDNLIRSTAGSGIYLNNSSDLTLVNNQVQDSASHGLYLTQVTRAAISGGYVTRSGSRVSGGTRKGVYVTGSSNSILQGTEVFDNSDIGVYLVEGTTGFRVKNVVAHHNARAFERIAAGIESRSDGNIVESSIGYSNEDSGINMRWGGSNGLVVNNISFNNGDHGIDVLDSPGVRIVANTVYRNVTAGINVEGNSSNALLMDNISVGNASNSPRTTGNIRVTKGSMPSAADFNIVYAFGTDRLYEWSGVSYRTLSYLKKDFPGVETRGIQADPKWVAPDSGDFHLSAGSPAIDSGKADAIATAEYSQDAEGRQRCDDTTVSDSGEGPSRFYDRGALERLTDCAAGP
jgi:parallel beta-helix repeat protein